MFRSYEWWALWCHTNDLTLGITNYFLVWYYITLMQTCKSKILRYLNLDNMSALSLLIAHFCPKMHAVTKIIDLRKFCQSEWIFMDLKIWWIFTIFITACISGHTSIPKFIAVTVCLNFSKTHTKIQYHWDGCTTFKKKIK